MNDLIFARSIHVVAIVLWIGGVAFVTTVLIPAIKRYPDPSQRFKIFEQLETRFALQAKVTTLCAGASGFYMLNVLHAWGRYQLWQFWWLHLMTLVWVIFTLVLFVFEPLFLHQWFKAQALKDSDNAFLWLHRMHKALLSLSLIAVLGAVPGSHGFLFLG